jgi:hypothetical protein
MFHRTLAFVVAVSSLGLVSTPAAAAVTGAWDVSGTVKVRVTVPGVGSQGQKVAFVDHFTFSEGGSFEMLDALGTWTQGGKKGQNFAVQLSSQDMEDLFEAMFADFDLTADLSDVQASISGKQKRSDAIKGTLNLTGDIDLSEFGFSGGLTATGKFTGVRDLTPALGVDATAVPLPGAAWLLGPALIGLAGRARRRACRNS